MSQSGQLAQTQCKQLFVLIDLSVQSYFRFTAKLSGKCRDPGTQIMSPRPDLTSSILVFTFLVLVSFSGKVFSWMAEVAAGEH